MTQYGLEIKVTGFADARRWMYRLIDLGIVKCDSCDNPAVAVFWQDKAEWYLQCSEHRDYGQQWTGSTNYFPLPLYLPVIGDVAREWYDTLNPDDKAKVTLDEMQP